MYSLSDVSRAAGNESSQRHSASPMGFVISHNAYFSQKPTLVRHTIHPIDDLSPDCTQSLLRNISGALTFPKPLGLLGLILRSDLTPPLIDTIISINGRYLL